MGSVLESGMTARELLQKIPSIVDGGSFEDAVIQYDIAEPLYHVAKGGHLEAHDGVAEAPDVIVRASDADLLRLLRGQLSARRALLTGKLKVRGDLRLAQRLVGIVDREAVARL